MPPAPLPSLVTWIEVQSRLEMLFPIATSNRNWLIRDIAAKTVFVMLYVGATESSGSRVGPKHIYKMTDKQAELVSQEQRFAYDVVVRAPGYSPNGKSWFADNTREPIRDETLKEGLIRVGAVGFDSTVPTTSSKPRYFLKADFAALFDPALIGDALEAAISKWRTKHLTASELKRTLIVAAADVADAQISVKLPGPGGGTRTLEPGPTQVIAKKFLEDFVPRFFNRAHIIFLSQSGQKVVHADHKFAQQLGLDINAGKLLPDLILAETEPRLVLVFVEFVASDGPISEKRKEELQQLASNTKLPASDLAFVTAFLDRSSPPFKSRFAELAWNSFAWCAGEPERLIALFDQREPSDLKLDGVLRLMVPNEQ
ncbi:MAG: BsuBI/PstI family type II restriction endonuclease [Myxococcales bacterium]|nr:BsuBI/PstI family type II restriction endonuclease [Myxococcales bacterium]